MQNFALFLKANNIFLKLKVVTTEGMEIIYANVEIQMCHPVIVRFTCNNEKQVVITGIKLKIQYPIYIVPLDKR